MRVDVIGASGTYPVPGRPAAGFLITQGRTRVWVDAGPGTFTGLPVDPDLVDAVVVSHQHPDHCSDLLTAYHAWTFRPEPRRGIPLYAPSEVWDRVLAFLGNGPESRVHETFDFTAVGDGDSATIDELEVAFVGMDHSVPTVGSRWVANNRVLFYTADTGPGGDWAARVGEVHVMLCEASNQGRTEDKPYPHHLTAGEAGRIARDVGARKLVLTHIPPYLDPALSVHEAEVAFDRPVALAVPGSGFDV